MKIIFDFNRTLFIQNEDGFVLVIAMIMMVILTIMGVSATNTTTIELQIAGNDRSSKEDFYNQENCVLTGLFKSPVWMTTSYLLTSEATAYFPTSGSTGGNCTDTSGTVVGSFKVRDIEPTGAAIFSWGPSDPANNYPRIAFRDKPDPGSGYDPKNFEVRRFVITSYGSNQKAVVQAGIYKVFNKF